MEHYRISEEPERAIRPGHLELQPLSLKRANEFVQEHHRHHKPVPGMKFALGAVLDGQLVGVAIVGRPVARNLDDGTTLEVNRTCTDGTPHANSFLYGHAWRVVKAMGYRKLITYTLQEESGASLRAVQWENKGLAGGGNWNCQSRPRENSAHQQKKVRWEKHVD
jgi:hypothetical protein